MSKAARAVPIGRAAAVLLAEAEDALFGRARLCRDLGLRPFGNAAPQLPRRRRVVGPAGVEGRQGKIHFTPFRMAIRLNFAALQANRHFGWPFACSAAKFWQSEREKRTR